MKKQINTSVVVTTILASVKAKLHLAINFAEITSINLPCARLYMERAEEQLFLLETIFYCEQESAIETRIKDFRIKLTKEIFDLGSNIQVSKECLEAINNLEYDIEKELEKAEFPPANIDELLKEAPQWQGKK
jgi:hypothetical protein